MLTAEERAGLDSHRDTLARLLSLAAETRAKVSRKNAQYGLRISLRRIDAAIEGGREAVRALSDAVDDPTAIEALQRFEGARDELRAAFDAVLPKIEAGALRVRYMEEAAERMKRREK